MKKWVTAIVLLLFALLETESAGSDIDLLEPVAALQVITEPEGIRIMTDTGSEGYGETISRCVKNLHESASSVIFLDTVQYLLVDRESYLAELEPILRPACQVCLALEPVDLELVPRYLKVHDRKTTLLDYRAEAAELPLLYSKEGRSQIVP